MYKLTRLKLDSFKVFYEECERVGFVVDGEIITANHDYCMDLIGELSRPTGKTLTDEDGSEYPEMEKLEGYHVNIKHKGHMPFSKFIVETENPLRKFAGD